MIRKSLDTSRVPKDALTYTDEKFFKLIRSFCGKDGTDLLSIQAIRSVRILVRFIHKRRKERETWWKEEQNDPGGSNEKKRKIASRTTGKKKQKTTEENDGREKHTDQNNTT